MAILPYLRRIGMRLPLKFQSVPAVVVVMVAFNPFASAEPITVSVAISLKPALQTMDAEYNRASGDTLTFNFGASGTLLGQIKAGAPVDLFISAADKQVSELIKDGLADAAGRQVIARGRLALIVPAKQTDTVTSFKEVATDKVERLAIGQPKTVPAGDYASQALAKADLSANVAEKLVYGTNVRQVLDYVVRGEVDAGLVYATDAKEAGETVKVVELIDPSLHDPIIYRAVVLKDAAHRAAAERFITYLLSDAGQRVLSEKGFDPATAAPQTTAPTTVPAR